MGSSAIQGPANREAFLLDDPLVAKFHSEFLLNILSPVLRRRGCTWKLSSTPLENITCFKQPPLILPNCFCYPQTRGLGRTTARSSRGDSRKAFV